MEFVGKAKIAFAGEIVFKARGSYMTWFADKVGQTVERKMEALSREGNSSDILERLRRDTLGFGRERCPIVQPDTREAAVDIRHLQDIDPLLQSPFSPPVETNF